MKSNYKFKYLQVFLQVRSEFIAQDNDNKIDVSSRKQQANKENIMG